ncbi:87_t:CDS:2, partial [Gigaspora rosea]
RSQKSKLEKLKKTQGVKFRKAKVLGGCGRKPMYPALEEELVKFIKEKQDDGLALKYRLLKLSQIDKNEELIADESNYEGNNEYNEEFVDEFGEVIKNEYEGIDDESGEEIGGEFDEENADEFYDESDEGIGNEFDKENVDKETMMNLEIIMINLTINLMS